MRKPAAQRGMVDRLRRAARSTLRQHFPAGLEAYRAMRTEWHGVQARLNRGKVGTYVGVTGSCGKSTATYLIGRLLREQGSVRAVVWYNTRPKILRSLAQLDCPVDFLVQEISGHRPGQIKAASRIARPDVALVTAVGQDHHVNFKDLVTKGHGNEKVDDRYLAVIAEEKGSLVAALGPQGVACLDADKPLVRAMAARARGRVILFGTSADAEVRAENAVASWPDRLSFDLVIDGARRKVQTRFVGTLMLNTILAALGVVRAVGGDVDRAADALASIEPLSNRMSVAPGTDGHTYILDTAKAPLWQTRLLLEDLPSLKSDSLVFVLGEVSDTRNGKSAIYRQLLRRASEVATHVIGFGPAASNAARVRDAGRDNVVALETYDEAVRYLAGLPPSLVVLKSNKSIKMSRIWEAVAPPELLAASARKSKRS